MTAFLSTISSIQITSGAFRCRLCNCRFHFLRYLRRVRRARAQHDLKSRVHELNGAHKMNDPLLPRDAPDKKQIRFRRIDFVPNECGR